MTRRQKERRNKQLTQKVLQVTALIALGVPTLAGGSFVLACVCVKAAINFGWM